MPCKQYEDALMEAAANGADPQGDLRVHLAGCADCRAAFEQERALFASIDIGLHVAANAEVPVSLLPRVRARLDEESASRSIWSTNWLVLASAAVIIVGFFAVRTLWRPNVPHEPGDATVKALPPQQVTAPSQNRSLPLVPPKEKDSTSPLQEVAARLPRRHEQAKGKPTPEVLVPHDQEPLLAEYAEQWSLHKHHLLLAQGFDATILSPLQVAPIQIDELGVKLSAEEKLQ